MSQSDGTGSRERICSKAAERFGNSAIAKRAAEQAAKALFSQGGGSRSSGCRAADPLYIATTSKETRPVAKDLPTANKVEQQLHAVMDKSMDPFLVDRQPLHLDDNRAYEAPSPESRPIELFSGQKNYHITPEPHSQAVCSTTVHGGNQRFTVRSPDGVRCAHMQAAKSPQRTGNTRSDAPEARVRAPSRQQKKAEVDRLRCGAVSHGTLPAQRPFSPILEDAVSMCELHAVPQSHIQCSASLSCLHPMADNEMAGASALHTHAAVTPASVITAAEPQDEAGLPPGPADENTTAEVQQSTACAPDPHQATSPEAPARTSSPDIPTDGGNRPLPAHRPLSPIGKAVKASPMPLRHFGSPDMSCVKSRYLQHTEGEGRSKTMSPSREAAHERHYLWKLGKMHADVPDYKRSQPRMYESSHCLGTIKDQHVVTLKQVYWSFDGAHPALAEQHYLRTPQQNEALEWERAAAQGKLEVARAAASELRRRSMVQQRQCRSASPRTPTRVSFRKSVGEAHSVANSQAVDGSDLGQPGGPMQHAACDVDMSTVQHQSSAITARAEKALEHSAQLANSCEACGITRPSTDAEQSNQGTKQEHLLRSGTAAHDALQPQAQHLQHGIYSSSDAAETTSLPVKHLARQLTRGTEDTDGHDQDATADVSADDLQDGRYAAQNTSGVNEAVASGKYSAHRYAEYTRGLEEDMQIRLQAGKMVGDLAAGYESDLERDETYWQQEQSAEALSHLQASNRSCEADVGAPDSFMEDNAWMDQYRRGVVSRCQSEGIPPAGYFDDLVACGFNSPEPVTRHHEIGLTDTEHGLLKQEIIPGNVGLEASRAILKASRVTGRDYTESSGYHSEGGNLSGRYQGKPSFVPTKSQGFAFERRAMSRPKPISQVKLEQDLEMKRREEEAEHATKFVAKEVPRTSSKRSDGLYYKKLYDKDQAAKARVSSRKEELETMLAAGGAAFSFYEKDMQRMHEKQQRIEAHRNNKAKFQVKFKAKEVPSHVKEQRFLSILEERERRKLVAQQTAQIKLDVINDEFEKSLGRVAGAMAAAMQPFVGTIEDNIMYAKAENRKSVHPFVLAAAKAVGLHGMIMQLPKQYKMVIQERGLGQGHHELNNAELHLLALARKNFQVRAKHAALRNTDTVWNKHSGAKKRMGTVPDFDALHAQWETQLSLARSEMKQRIPPAQDFSFNKGTPIQQAERAARAEEKRQRILLDKLLDEEELVEQRWPFKSVRGRVHPTPPPVFAPAIYSDTRTSRLRRRHTQECAKKGQFESRDVKQQIAMSAHKEEMQRRAKAHVAQEQQRARQKIHEALEDSNGDLRAVFSELNPADQELSVQVSQEAQKVEHVGDGAILAEDRLAEAHRKSRHNKIESDITNMTREILAEKGLDVLRFVEDAMTPKQMLDAVTESAPRTRAEVRQRLSQHDDKALKLMLQEVGLEWGTGSDARTDSLARLAQHVHNFML